MFRFNWLKLFESIQAITFSSFTVAGIVTLYVLGLPDRWEVPEVISLVGITAVILFCSIETFQHTLSAVRKP
nr:MAG TPA: hypothetical protein [Caudoviricetes sp.]